MRYVIYFSNTTAGNFPTWKVTLLAIVLYMTMVLVALLLTPLEVAATRLSVVYPAQEMEVAKNMTKDDQVVLEADGDISQDAPAVPVLDVAKQATSEGTIGAIVSPEYSSQESTESSHAPKAPSMQSTGSQRSFR